ncbi:glycosyltransferase [Flexibacterium corallicola]|uniref:glycosyltransferase n=1 Tax=Flexibacterium corallicola TaxID=3037259 RepID=UPI00286EEB74|nr:glycosyltransferase [Pseudovibrio sp. M1P-2-3]
MDRLAGSKGLEGAPSGLVATTIAQRLVFPDDHINGEADLYYHFSQNSRTGFKGNFYFVASGGSIHFNSYFNSFPLYAFDLDTRHLLSLSLQGTGDCTVFVYRADLNKTAVLIQRARVSLQEGHSQPVPLELDDFDNCLIYFSVVAETDVKLIQADYVVLGPPCNDVSLTAVITTFKQDEAVQSTGHRLQDYMLKNKDLRNDFNLLVVDNGGATDAVSFDQSHVIKNRNFGGAGGFMRGLLEAKENKMSSHILFMDDDAVFHPENIRRTLSVLRYSKRPNLAISGAMITAQKKWRMWENGAIFHRRCQPMHCGKDLRKFEDVVRSALDTPKASENRYGGWWYFCFPIDQVESWTFPFFVRGDDIYFSLANNFEIIGVSGVASHQETFSIKKSPLIVYLDMRYHLINHSVFKRLGTGRFGKVSMMWSYFNRYNASYHYESAAAVNIAMEDVLSGPKFWENNLDMVRKRQQFANLTKNEKVKENFSCDLEKTVPNGVWNYSFFLWAFLRFLTLNGHLLPKFVLHKKGRRMPLDRRANIFESFLRPYVVTIDAQTFSGYKVEKSLRKYMANLLRFARNATAFLLKNRQVNADYRAFAKEVSTEEFWKDHLLEKAEDQGSLSSKSGCRFSDNDMRTMS